MQTAASETKRLKLRTTHLAQTHEHHYRGHRHSNPDDVASEEGSRAVALVS